VFIRVLLQIKFYQARFLYALLLSRIKNDFACLCQLVCRERFKHIHTWKRRLDPVNKTILVLALMMSLAVWLPAKPPVSASEAADYLDKMCMDLMYDLRDTAQSEAVAKSDWKGIKPHLTMLDAGGWGGLYLYE